MLSRRAFSASAVCVFLQARSAFGQQAEGPHYQIGDTWTFLQVTNGQERRFRETISSIDGAEVIVTFGQGPNMARRSAALNAFDLNGKEIMSVRHPVVVGARWDYDFLFEPADRSFRTTNTRSARVTGVEKIQTAVGELECLLIEAKGFWTNLKDASQMGANGNIVEKSWYSPAVRRVARYEGRSTARGTGSTVEVWAQRREMLAYKLA
jgi:hypothetical protein